MVPGETKQSFSDMCAITNAAINEAKVRCAISEELENNDILLTLPASLSASQFKEIVKKNFSYNTDNFSITYYYLGKAIKVDQYLDETLEELGFSTDPLVRNSVTVYCVKPLNMTESKEISSTDDEQQTVPDIVETHVAPPPVPPFLPGATELISNYSNSLPGQDNGFVGLVNQAMTCYLNSLLQTLFMTPEFRNALYKWEFDGTEEDGTKSIPFQLQKLFLLLQTSKKPAVGTTELTTSFGWDSSEAWQQHDVQELCRVMFDALEHKFKNTEQADLISTLYEGKMKDYVKCLECGNESAREDTFLDVPLVVRPFGSSQAYLSVNEALKAFVTPEILQGSNQYFCEKCNKKCDAHKGLKFIRFPYMLTLQLKRFDFDPVTMHRIKLNDRISFPEILNLNVFIKSESDVGCEDVTPDEESVYLTTPASETSASSENEDDEGIDVDSHRSSSENSDEWCINEKNLKKSMEKGPYVYELFSIMVHSGSANGGHYYAYIKSFKNGEWYCFNDAQVTKITHDDIQKTYGGGPSRGYYSSSYSSSTNAYMLMYRQIDKKRNAECMSFEELPEHIKALLQCMQKQEERERIQRELDRSMCKIKLFCQHPVQKRMNEMKLKLHKDTTLAEATQTAHSIMNLEGVVPLECCRLIKYDYFDDSLESSFKDCDDVPMGELLGGVKSSYKFDFFLEIRKSHEEFREYKPGGTTIKVHVVDLESEEVAVHPLTIRSHPSDSVQDLEKQIAQAIGIPTDTKIRIVLEVSGNEFNLLDDPQRMLSSVGFRKSNKVFVEFKDKEDAEKQYRVSKLFKVIDTHAHTICVHMTFPKIDKAEADRLKSYDDAYEEEKCDISSDEDEDSADKACTEVSCRCKNSKGDLQGAKIREAFSSSPKVSYPRNFKSLDYDEGLGDSEMGDSVASFCQTPIIHSDQSEDSSLTDSERTLIGDEMSPRNNSPDIEGGDIEQDVEPACAKPECDAAFTNINAWVAAPPDKDRNLSSPEENTEDTQYDPGTAGRCCKNVNACGSQPVKRYFRAWPYNDYETGEKMLRVYVDKRITLMDLKKELEPHIGIKADSFKIFRVYSNNQEFECTRLTDNLMSYEDDSRLTIKLGRALRKGEYKVKIYQLCLNEPETLKLLIEWVLVKGMTVLRAKKEILPRIQEACGLEIPLNRCRLRKKCWKNPGSIFFDHQRFEKDIPVNSNWEMLLEVLPDAEPVTSPDQLTVFTRRWHPAAYKLDNLKEIVLEDSKHETLMKKLFEISGIPEESIEFAKGVGPFPCETSLLTLHRELCWSNQESVCNEASSPLSLGDHGSVIFYRDKREELKKLTEEEKREISNKENAKTIKGLKTYYSPRKEKALKIYTVDSTPTSSQNSLCSTSSNTVSSNTKSRTNIVPDLD